MPRLLVDYGPFSQEVDSCRRRFDINERDHVPAASDAGDTSIGDHGQLAWAANFRAGTGAASERNHRPPRTLLASVPSEKRKSLGLGNLAMKLEALTAKGLFKPNIVYHKGLTISIPQA